MVSWPSYHYNGNPYTWKEGLYIELSPGGWFNIKTTSYQYRKSHCGDKTILRLSYLHNGISYTGKMSSLYWTRALISNFQKYPMPHFHLHSQGQAIGMFTASTLIRINFYFVFLAVSVSRCGDSSTGHQWPAMACHCTRHEYINPLITCTQSQH